MKRKKDRNLDKYAVEEEKDQDAMKRAFDKSACPKCGRKVERHGDTLLCPNCGTEPFEKK